MTNDHSFTEDEEFVHNIALRQQTDATILGRKLRRAHYEGISRINKLNAKLIQDNRLNDLIAATQDQNLQRQLLEEYEI